MIIRKKEMVVEPKENILGGEGKGTFTYLCPPELLKDEMRMFNMVTLESGSSIGLHEHRDNFELYYILEGSGICNDDGTEEAVCAGDLIYTADGAKHSVTNTGTEPLKMVATVIFENKQ